VKYKILTDGNCFKLIYKKGCRGWRTQIDMDYHGEPTRIGYFTTAKAADDYAKQHYGIDAIRVREWRTV